MSSGDKFDEHRQGGAVWPRRERKWRGWRASVMEPPHENESFERYVSQRLSSFLCGQLVTLLLGYIVLIAGDIWLKRDMRGLAALASTLPTIPMALAAVVAWSARGRLCASLATLLFIGVLEAGVVQYALLHSGEPGAALAAFVVIPLAFSPVLLRGWDFPAAAVLAAAGPIAVVALRASPALEAFGVAISMFTAISTSLVTNVFAIALQRKHFRLEQQLRAFADSDELTQLPRRRRVLELGRRMLHRAERLEQPISALYIDADHFKSVNDRFGHDAGDRALRLIAREIRESLRSADVCGRFGGEEFVALLWGTEPSEAAHIAERLRRRISELRFDVMLTISVGVAQHVRGEQIDRVIRRADAALLDAKDSGRNRVVIARETVEHAPAFANITAEHVDAKLTESY